jgi:hypothetical protein
MKRLILLGLFISLKSFSQDPDPLTIERANLAQKKMDNEAWEKEQFRNIDEAEKKLKKNQSDLLHVTDLLTNHEKYVKQVSDEIAQSLSDLPVLKRVGSKKAAFYRCLKGNLKNKDKVGINSCQNEHAANFDQQEKDKIKIWSELVSLNQEDLKSNENTVKEKISDNQQTIDRSNKNLVSVKYIKKQIKDQASSLKLKEDDQRVIKENTKFINCDENSPDISLEEKEPFAGATFQGPFFGVPRDNQDGLGTCYANAAKNMLVSASKGESVASFLDLALLYKEKSGGLSSSGLDGGGSCSVLEEVNAKGYCPQTFAPLETGEKNLYAKGLMGDSPGSVWDEANMLGVVRKFFVSKDNLSKGNTPFSKQVLGQAGFIIENIKSRPNLNLPLPVVRHQIPSGWKLSESFNWHVKDIFKITEDDFVDEFNANYKKFYPLYLKGVIEAKTKDQIFDLYKESMKDFISKYKLDDQLESWKKSFFSDTNSDFSDPQLKKSVEESLGFLKLIFGKKDQTNDDFVKDCGDQAIDLSSFLANLQPLIRDLNKKNASTDLLFDDQGNFKSPSDLIQLVIAPECLNKEKREKLKFEIDCQYGYDTIIKIRSSGKSIEDQKRMLREKVVASLIQGYSLGNNFDHHINSIVGMRYDKTSKRCEFKIRESQTGISSWQTESSIFDQIEAVATVRRK